jgi:hypothetical protein
MDRIDENLQRLWSVVRERNSAAGSPPGPHTSHVAVDRGSTLESVPTAPAPQVPPIADLPTFGASPTLPERAVEPSAPERRAGPAASPANPSTMMQLGSPRSPMAGERPIQPSGRDLRRASQGEGNRGHFFEVPPRVESGGILRRLLRWFGL